MADEPKRIDIAEFREFGYLHEINRQLLHPLGLALEVVQDKCEKCGGFGRRAPRYKGEVRDACEECGGTGLFERLGGVWDSREDPEGFVYGDDLLDPAKVARVAEELDRRTPEREARLGYLIQPVQKGGS